MTDKELLKNIKDMRDELLRVTPILHELRGILGAEPGEDIRDAARRMRKRAEASR